MRYLFFIVCCLLFTKLNAQTNNLRAKLAYQNAEAAFESKNTTEGLAELAKVDEYLGNLTPRSQYLRVQLWLQAATDSSLAHIDSALYQANAYLALAGSFEIAEEKQLEVLQAVNKLEKARKVAAAKAAVIADCKRLEMKWSESIPLRNQSAIATLTGFDWTKDVFAQLKDQGRTKGGITKSDATKEQVYRYKNGWYYLPATFYSNSYKAKPFQSTELNVAIKDFLLVTTNSGAFLSWMGNFTVPVTAAGSTIEAINTTLGFAADLTFIDSTSVPNYKMTYLYWWFNDYAVNLYFYRTGADNNYFLIVSRHLPHSAQNRHKASCSGH